MYVAFCSQRGQFAGEIFLKISRYKDICMQGYGSGSGWICIQLNCLIWIQVLKLHNNFENVSVKTPRKCSYVRSGLPGCRSDLSRQEHRSRWLPAADPYLFASPFSAFRLHKIPARWGWRECCDFFTYLEQEYQNMIYSIVFGLFFVLKLRILFSSRPLFVKNLVVDEDRIMRLLTYFFYQSFYPIKLQYSSYLVQYYSIWDYSDNPLKGRKTSSDNFPTFYKNLLLKNFPQLLMCRIQLDWIPLCAVHSTEPKFVNV